MTRTPLAATPLVVSGPTLTFLLVSLVFLVVGAGLVVVGVLRGRRKPEGRLVQAVVAPGLQSHGEGFPERRPDFEWTDEAGSRHCSRSTGVIVPGLWVGDEVVVRLDPKDESRATLVTDTPPRRELVLVGVSCVLVALLLGAVGLNEWIGTGQ
ncbi:MAG TPA: DUF3592 domain-containing protein [Marmoricola sp.]|nr:DUF3592 domain-containing protein [Marmoricola sp.]